MNEKLEELKAKAWDAQLALLEATTCAQHAEIKFCSDAREIFGADDMTAHETRAAHRAAVLAYKNVIRVFHDAQQTLEEISAARRVYDVSIKDKQNERVKDCS